MIFLRPWQFDQINDSVLQLPTGSRGVLSFESYPRTRLIRNNRKKNFLLGGWSILLGGTESTVGHTWAYLQAVRVRASFYLNWVT